jgi:hypothetical protein
VPREVSASRVSDGQLGHGPQLVTRVENDGQEQDADFAKKTREELGRRPGRPGLDPCYDAAVHLRAFSKLALAQVGYATCLS